MTFYDFLSFPERIWIILPLNRRETATSTWSINKADLENQQFEKPGVEK